MRYERRRGDQVVGTNTVESQISISGDFDRSPFAGDSPAIIALAR
jgi:hypothetical protein